MLKRKIEETLIAWKDTPDHNPLIVKGCRQCGKTSSVRDFAERHYKNVVYLNFFENPSYSVIFSGSLEIEHLVMMMTALLGTEAKFEDGNTVIILDEIQECPEARTSLKFFKLDGRFDVIGTGSLLGVKGYGKLPKSVPVGFETIIEMRPLDFEEFLWANNINEQMINLLKECLNKETPVPEALHHKLQELFLEYVVVGGMPAVVKEYVATKHMNTVLELQRSILNEYEDDMIKYAEDTDKPFIRECFDSIPKQLAKENKKFQYSTIRKKGTAKMYGGCLQWIEDAGIINRCYNLEVIDLPLDGNALSDTFKVYMADTGLFIGMLEDGTQFDVLQGNLNAYKGAIFENAGADLFSKMGRKLYYYRKDSGLEIDFIIRYKGEATLVEVKATSGQAKAAKTVLNHPEKYHVKQCIKMGTAYNVGRATENDSVLTLPLYMGFLLTER